MLTADPRQAAAAEIDQIMVTGTAPAPFEVNGGPRPHPEFAGPVHSGRDLATG